MADIELVIKIPEDVYKKIVADKYAIYDKMFYSIKNGTPFPKGHGDLIDKIYADIQSLRGCSCSCSDGIIDDVEDILDKYTEKE